MTALRPQFVLFGDSITQRSFAPGGWASALADAYQRRVDVLNRGYSGYNTRWALPLLDHIFPAAAGNTTNVQLATVFFGANDAALPDRPSVKQHVPLTDYTANMRSIVTHLQSRLIPAIILITPPPIYEDGRLAHVFATYNVQLEAAERTNEVTGQYAEAVRALGAELNLPVVDLWTEFQKIDSWQTALLNDGLHLTPEGNALVGKLVLGVIHDAFEQLKPESMKWDVPEWSELMDAEDAGAAVAAHIAAEK